MTQGPAMKASASPPMVSGPTRTGATGVVGEDDTD
jgi:hypothetical protein